MDLTAREIQLIEDLGTMKRILESYDRIMLTLAVRNGGSIVMKHDEIHYNMQHYTLEKQTSSTDLTMDMILKARIK